MQKKIRNSINTDGTVNNKMFQKIYKSGLFGNHPFHFGGFVLGFFLSFIGVLIAYLIRDDDEERRSDRRYWAWEGLLFGLLIVVALAKLLL